ncbi:DsbA family protein [bacterium]|jgi:protein-disulfide isomerase|nr:DsbA family protein [bacterium]
MIEEGFENAPKINEKIVKKSTFNVLIITIIFITGIAAFFAGSYVSNFNSDKISQEELENAIAKLELKILEKQLPTNQPALPLKISSENNPVIGNPDAPITIIEFSDFQCPFCAKFHMQTLPTIMDEYINKGIVKLVFRDFPIQNIHPNAVPASIAAECANEQGKFEQMYHMLFEKQKEWSNLETSYAITAFNQYASEIQLDEEKFDSCIKNVKYIEEVQKDLNEGRTYGVTGTPGFFIGNEEIGFMELKGAQPFESFKKIIDIQLKN